MANFVGQTSGESQMTGVAMSESTTSSIAETSPQPLAGVFAQADASGELVGGDGDDVLLAAGPHQFTAQIQPVNDSGVTGTATLAVDGDQLTVRVEASGLESGQIHMMHIHGLTDADTDLPRDSTVPPTTDDTDGDGFVEIGEGAASVGPVILPLTSPPGGGANDFPTATNGVITFEQAFDLGQEGTLAEGFTATDLFPLELRVVHLHGLTVAAEAGAGTPGEVDGTGGFKPGLPVATGEIEPAPSAATTAAPATLSGENGNDRLIGGTGDDQLSGGAGNDVLDGGDGAGSMSGGAGGDLFVFGRGGDVVTDFSASQGDRLLAAGGENAETLIASAETTADGTTITTGSGTLTLAGVVASDLTADWFAA